MAKPSSDAWLSLEDEYWDPSGQQFVMLRNRAGGGVQIGAGLTADQAKKVAIKELKRLIKELELAV